MRPWLRASMMTFLTATALGMLWAVPVSTTRAPAQSTIAGSDVFRTYCVACHGADAKGTGPLASSLKRRPADLTQLTTRNDGTFPREMVAQVIDGRNPVKGHGGGDMPVWGEAMLKSQDGGSETVVKDRIESLVAYLQSLQK